MSEPSAAAAPPAVAPVAASAPLLFKNKEYHRYIRSVMAFKHNIPFYPQDRRFTQEELVSLTAIDVKRWLCVMAFGNPDPDENDPLTNGRSASLEMAKKCVSWYMPNRLATWDCITLRGNPTRSTEVNDLIKRVRKAEVRGIGKASQSRRPLTIPEFRKTGKMIGSSIDPPNKYRWSAMIKVSWNLIMRSDDVANHKLEDLQTHPSFRRIALQTKVRWSKNVMEERECPPQILLGAMDPEFCVLLALGIWLELFLINAPDNRLFLFSQC